MNKRKLFSFLPALSILGLGTSKANQTQSASTEVSPQFVYVYFFANYDETKKTSEQTPDGALYFPKKFLERERNDVMAKCYTRALQEALRKNLRLVNPRFVQTMVPLFGSY